MTPSCQENQGSCGKTVMIRRLVTDPGERHYCGERVGHEGNHRCIHGYGWGDSKCEA